jgi:hypothetical protein
MIKRNRQSSRARSANLAHSSVLGFTVARSASGLSFRGVTPLVDTCRVTTHEPTDDPVPRRVLLDLDEAFRVLEALEDARLALRGRGAAPGLQDELATVIRVLHANLGLDEGGVCD